jgi:hypothetical protein
MHGRTSARGNVAKWAPLNDSVGEVMGYTMHTESGIPIDAVFGGRSVIKRIVNSHGIEGSTATILWLMDKKSVELFES